MNTAERLVTEAQELLNAADERGRPLTSDERLHVEDLLQRAEDHHTSAKKIREIGLSIGGTSSISSADPNVSFDYAGPGDMFVKSAGWKSIADPASRGQQWTTGPVDVGYSTKAGTLLESGQGAGLTVTPQVAPGIVSRLFEPLGVGDVFKQSQTTAASVRYMVEGTATNAAAGVGEGGTKPASDIAISTVDEPVKKIATVLTVSDELLEDAVQIQQYLNGRLNLFCTMEEERQLLRGAGTNELVGIFGRSINTYSKLATDDNATCLARVIANTAGSSFLQPDAIIMHPTNWLATRLLRDGTGGTIGQFFGGGPFSSAYGGAATNVGMFGQTLWNTRVVLSTVVGSGTALVGSFGQAAEIYRRGGRTVEASNSHASYFQSNLVMLRGESRAALACYRPSAFTAVSGLA